MRLRSLLSHCESSQILLYKFAQVSSCKSRNSSLYKRSPLTVKNDSLAEFKANLLSRTNHYPSIDEWKQFRNDLVQRKNINNINVDGIILGLCTRSEHLGLAKSFVQFLENEGLKPNYATLGRLLRLYYLCSQNMTTSSPSQREVIEIYDKIRKEQEIFDATTCENLIYGIILTDRWKESLELLDVIKISSSPNVTSYCVIISKAFENIEDHETGWKLLNEMVCNQRQPKCEVFISYFNAIQSQPKEFVKNLEKMLEFIGQNDIHISRKVIVELRQILSAFEIQNLVTELTKQGQCKICQSKLGNVSVSNDEFKELSTLFLEKVLIRNDVFLKSTPNEVETFIEFINKAPTYDCVIDGLNVAYSTGMKSSPKVYVQLLCSVVRHFVNLKQRVLVLGRKHMNGWPRNGMEYIKNNADIFFTNNLSQDDPFLLYATLKSGPKTNFFSRDLMRTHSFLLGFEHKKIFKRWQQEHQYSLITNTDNGRIIVKEPIRFNIQAHKIGSIWHIPFKDEYFAHPAETFGLPANWLCVTL